jgi:nitroreductase
MTLHLTADQVLTTTRAVRKRLDFDRDVSDDVIRDCIDVALQAPSGSNNPTMGFVVVKDAAKREAIGEVYKQCFAIYSSMDGVYIGSIDKGSDEGNAQQQRSTTSAAYLGENMAKAPAIVIGCHVGNRLDGVPAMMASSMLSNILPAMWSFMLAARERGLGTAWTTMHLMMEQQVADILGIPFDSVQQACLTPLAYTIGTDFKPTMRPPADSVIHWDGW